MMVEVQVESHRYCFGKRIHPSLAFLGKILPECAIRRDVIVAGSKCDDADEFVLLHL
jgi:hypothetical protein